MKTHKLLVIVVGLLFLFISCGGDDDKTDPQSQQASVATSNQQDNSHNSEYPVVDKPNWNIANYTSYENSMTAYLILPGDLSVDVMDTDEIAVFCNSECRGVAERIEVSAGEYVWIAYIYGNDENDALTIKYYSSKTSHMYQSENTISFQKDKHYGNIDNPQILNMTIIKSYGF